MEDFSTRTYGTSGLDNRPLFGETSARDRIINLVVGILTSLLILVTLISAFVFPQPPPKPLNIFFAVCISLSSITACILVPLRGSTETADLPPILTKSCTTPASPCPEHLTARSPVGLWSGEAFGAACG
ncbi:PREDICTED: transmembrane protein 243 isoform X1 [Myotis brandtii]|uniref:transmembrane protein 243 isoform X1 n=1 Tax=Myotis brandtii TaxID=109478 RepID=UPI0003BBDCFF|nr:PREDICTED: transmembrane protein 243 isoform X1 [Myotis brandtii]XP_014403070.1 PREDICTED: transmembrane protein 243 isoform X1 [Myotis brandtii]